MRNRGSKLALWQAHWAAGELEKLLPEITVEIKTIKTTGDKILDVALSRIGDKGLFTKEIENELLQGNIDIAVHSMKDLPSDIAPGLSIGAVMLREDPHDVLISRNGNGFDELPLNAVIGTSSLRRIAQLKSRRPDLKIIDIRGNVETRIRKLHEEGLDGIILAYAGVKRLGFESSISEILPYELVLPAAGQGCVAIETRSDDHKILDIVNIINHSQSQRAVLAERAFLKVLEGGCQVPIACLAEVNSERIEMQGLVASLAGEKIIRGSISASLDEPEKAGRDLGRQLLVRGADTILQDIRA
nr:hydroxymethylbilane synthase [Syntrophomonas palmitatica]